MNPTSDPLATLPDSDIVWNLMEALISFDKASGFSVALGTFSSTLLVLGSMFLGWHIIVGIVSSAYSGKVLGERYHQIWAPLRVILGFGMLVPIPLMNGFSPIHGVERLAFLAGVNMGNATANSAVEYVVKDGHPLTPISMSGRALAKQIAVSEVCSAILAQAYQRTSAFVGEGAPQSPPAAGGGIVVKPGRKAFWPWNDDAPPTVEGRIWDYGQACGSVAFSAPKTDEFGSFGEDRRKAVEALVGQVRAIGIPAPIAEVLKKSGTSERFDISKPSPDLSHIKEWVSSSYLVYNLAVRLNEIGDGFDTAVAASAAKNAANEDRDSRQKIVEGVQQHGWYLLGSYYRMLSRVSEKSASYAGEAPKYVAPNPQAWGGYQNEVSVAVALVQSQLSAESYKLVVSGDDLAAVGEGAGILATVTNAISEPVLAYLTRYDSFRPDPVGDLINIGNRLLGGSEIGFTAALGATSLASLTSAVTQTPQKVVEFVMVPGWWLIGGAFIAGAILTYVLPMMPYVFLTFALVILGIEIISFAIAGLLWALIHVRMDGDDFVSPAQTAGYQILFSLVLRQPITVLGFLGAHTISVAVFNAFLLTWNFAFIGSQGASSIGIVGVLIGFGMMIYIQWHIMLRLFGLMLELPPRVAAIMGHHIQGWGETEHGNTVIAGSAGGISTNGRLPTPMPKGPNGPKDGKASGGKGASIGGVTQKART
ncbi:DotA/TraY family protein [Mesorhizobium sophorae]|uniref:DotA/TraY family protein n=1 Tax=Mesorhizobium sophorae TaxID=1300294 RepID=UPI000BA31EA6|nr:DotA/TraY family protein [Mesorhizobium sophorae]